ncbi:MAG: RNA 2',3'-cyclic phosphodiesterase [Anaerolineae bacterium]|nr:RNA 2',3'-cyclic phosphodiesterase [Anaerolineae bacterium]
MRLFIAIELPEPLKDRLERLKTNLPGAIWTRRDTYHLTLRFLGDDIAAARLPDLRAALAAVQTPAFDVTLRGVGRFPPQPRRPARVLWVGVTPNPPLTRLYRAVESAVIGLGFPADDHDFSGHITLARLKSNQPEPSVEGFLKRHADFSADPFPAGAFHLFSSTLTPQGAHYAALAEFPLTSA